MTRNRTSNKCARKVRYESLELARMAAAALAKRRQNQGIPIVSYLKAYACRCGGFHFGSTRRIDWSRIN